MPVAPVDLRRRWLWGAVLALLPPALVVGLDVLRDLACVRAPATWYLAALALGAVLGAVLGAPLARPGSAGRLLRVLVLVAVACGAAAAGALAVRPVSWDARCAFRYCGRVLGARLDRSPYPVRPVTCSALHLCANEYPMSGSDSGDLMLLFAASVCDAP